MLLLSEPVAVVKAQCEFVYLVKWPSSHVSTLLSIQLIERFYDPLSGTICIDDQPISDLNVQEYRKQLALVSQEPVIIRYRLSPLILVTDVYQTLYAGTIRFNVLLGATKPVSEVTQEELEAACRDANILEFIQSLPE
jgi:ATP-binding cassette, subfamily B (MDR/TAP), member 1